MKALTGRMVSRATEQDPKNVRQSAIKIKFPQYERFSKRAFSKFRGMTRFESAAEREDSEIEISPIFAWLLLLMNIISSSLVPCWLMSNLKKEPHTRNSWRFFIMTLLTLPLVAYEKRKIE